MVEQATGKFSQVLADALVLPKAFVASTHHRVTTLPAEQLSRLLSIRLTGSPRHHMVVSGLVVSFRVATTPNRSIRWILRASLSTHLL